MAQQQAEITPARSQTLLWRWQFPSKRADISGNTGMSNSASPEQHAMHAV